jgi:hypothetical protein
LHGLVSPFMTRKEGKQKYLKKRWLLRTGAMLGFFLIIKTVSAQFRTSADFIVGAGFPEWIHVGARFQVGLQNQVGVYFGTMVSSYGFPLTISGDVNLRFGDEKRANLLKPWIARGYVQYLDLPNSHNDKRLIYVGGALGKEFMLGPSLGFCIDGGPMVRVSSTIERGSQTSSIYGAVLPMVRVQLFYRTYKNKSWLNKR